MYPVRLSSWMLGFIVTLMLPSFVSAMYDPGLGRFCSRDPVGFTDGANLFASYFGMDELDPGGESKGGKQNIWPSNVPKDITIEELQKLIEEAEKEGKKEHLKKLRGLLKVLKRGGRVVGPIGIWLCLEGTACAAEPTWNWRDPRYVSNCNCECDCTLYTDVLLIPSWWNVFYEGESFGPTYAGGPIKLGRLSAADCAAAVGTVDVEVQVFRGFTMYTTTYTMCTWGGVLGGAPDKSECDCDDCRK